MFAQGTNKLFHVTYNWKEWQRANDTVKWVSKEGLTHELSTQGSHPFLTNTSLRRPHHKKEVRLKICFPTTITTNTTMAEQEHTFSRCPYPT